VNKRLPHRSAVRWVASRLPVPIKRLLRGQRELPSVQDLIRAGQVSVGRHTYPQIPPVICYMGDTAKVRIGAFTSIAAGCEILIGGEHIPEWVTTFPLRIQFGLPGKFSDGLPRSKGDITIGNDVWLGMNATVLSGVNIGDGVVVAAGAVVTADVPPYAIVGGVPAKLLRFRFSPEQIKGLLEIAWWDWTDDEVRERCDDLSSPDVDSFISSFESRRSDGE
jgi:acetyltransferase-like isoleucine patch superfamily enzyme